MDQTVDQADTLTEQKLLKALQQFKRLGRREHSIERYKPSEIRVVFCLRERTRLGPAEITVSEISRRLNVTSPTITQVLKSLEAHELIERHIDTLDRREVGVKLTEHGEMVAQKAVETFSLVLHGLIAYLGEEQSDQLADLLFKAFRYFHEREVWMALSPWKGDEEA